LSDCLSPVLFNALPAIYRTNQFMGSRGFATIGSGNFFYRGHNEIDLLGQGSPAPDTLSTISSGIQGVRVTLRNGEAIPATNTMTINNAGNINVATSYVLNDANKALILEYDGANWQEIARY
jgi:hypothetical protein